MRFPAVFIAMLLAAASPVGVAAEGLSGARDFSFKRIKVGEGGPGQRITVQIDPVEQARLLALIPKVEPRAADIPPLPPIEEGGDRPQGPAPSNPARYAWFWETVPAALDQVADRFPLALATLTQGPDGASVPAPRLQQMQEWADRYGTDILKATIGTEVSPALALAILATESAGQPDAVSSAGAQGLMQLIPATAERFGVVDSKDPVQNIKGGVAYLDWLMTHFDRDPLMVIAAYNAGEGAVRANRGVPPYAETRDYVPKVLAAWQVAQGLCLTPPVLMTDPCVFKILSASN
jgi:Transglycosylase SLT domain